MRSSRAPDRGQAVVELALTLPLVALVLLGAAQVMAVAADRLLVTHLAREAARAAAVAADPGSAARAVVAELRPDDTHLDVHVGEQLDPPRVIVEVRRRHRTDVPLVGVLLPDATVSETVTMRREPP